MSSTKEMNVLQWKKEKEKKGKTFFFFPFFFWMGNDLFTPESRAKRADIQS